MTPGEELINNLNDLRIKLNDLSARLNSSGVERTIGLKTALGEDCRYYRKSMGLFLDKDYEDLRNKVKSLNDLFNLIEGK